MPIITKIFNFCAAHQYGHADWSREKNLAVFGEDADLHGHNYALEISVTGPVDPDTGYIVDLGLLSEIVRKRVLSHLDHHQIEKDVPWFAGKQPSTENMVLFIWEQLADALPGEVRLVNIKIQETPTIFSSYSGPED
ncbi:MAG: 6-carboxytetrahydropterin synthase [FCB group bacterium]|nr:6-carboxytetrahydropterin synthase [FCB group bacterium]